MKLEIKRDAILILPENEQDDSFIEDTLGLKQNGFKLEVERVNEVTMGYQKNDRFVLKIKKI